MDPHSLIVLAVDRHEPSKLPFYFVGGAVVVWAVVLSAIGLSRPDFPGESRLARMVMVFSALLVVSAMAVAVITS
jgi:hypothetical protein